VIKIEWKVRLKSPILIVKNKESNKIQGTSEKRKSNSENDNPFSRRPTLPTFISRFNNIAKDIYINNEGNIKDEGKDLMNEGKDVDITNVSIDTSTSNISLAIKQKTENNNNNKKSINNGGVKSKSDLESFLKQHDFDLDLEENGKAGNNIADKKSQSSNNNLKKEENVKHLSVSDYKRRRGLL